MSSEKLLSFEVGGLPLYAVLHEPAAPGPVGVVLLGGWSGTRVGPHGILTAAARRLADAGFAALRFDYRGRGDSGGAQRDAHIGTMAEDAAAAVKELQSRTGATRVVLLGICAGAQIAMAAAPAIDDLAALILWSPPPFHPDLAPDESAEPGAHRGGAGGKDEGRRQKDEGRNLLGQYWRKLFDPRTWEKLRRGGLQPRVILKILMGKPVRTGSAVAGRDTEAGWAGPKPDEKRFEEALPKVSVPALFVYGSADPEQQEAREYYKELRRARAEQTTFEVVEGANHSFYSLEWKEDVIRKSLSWLQVICCESCS